MEKEMKEAFPMDVEKLLREGKTVQVAPKGFSMYPMFVPGRDQAVIAPAEPERLKRGDVALYRRDGGILVLHRICRRKNEQFYFVGDNQTEVEGPLRPDQIRGILVSFIRKERQISVKNPVYRLASWIWLVLRPVRPVIQKPLAWGKKLIKNRRS